MESVPWRHQEYLICAVLGEGVNIGTGIGQRSGLEAGSRVHAAHIQGHC